MNGIESLEKKLAGMYEQLPHLPKGGRQWLGENAWWLVIIGVVLSVMGLIAIVSALLFVGGAITALGGVSGGSVGAAVGAVAGGVILVAGLVSIAVFVAETVLMGMAISPLKEHKKRGWTLLFYVALINAASVIVTSVLNLNIFSLVFGLFWVAVGGYFLFEVHGFFGGKAVATKEAEVVTPKKAVEADSKDDEKA